MAHDLTLELDAIRIAHPDGTPLVNLDTTIAPGETLTLMGPSGVGKSTLLAYIAGFLPSALCGTGSVRQQGIELTALPAERRGIGLLFQDPLLFPHLDIAGNLAFGLPRCGSRDERAARIATALRDIGLGGFEKRDPSTLSGGQQARVALMRVLLSRPRAILLDEPFSRLDTERRQEVRALTFAQIRASGLPTLLVTHDRDDAAATDGRIMELSASEAAP
ncbi:putative thiamine transport system ATP-binding protein [Chromohalobacter canadensis]|uniref:Putative thiamine transport system ATP-binding protein n=1 Tax=Chromohalobacter canadensis TaxID=141389 RepID=A0A285VG82_9GAMM|nr:MULTISPECIES: ATP-binding cassette domain-containing protein [Chromohalobacter]SOC53090.1 putative thiamine transport system ATP-binding protein [Chromohalobacter canadensis]